MHFKRKLNSILSWVSNNNRFFFGLGEPGVGKSYAQIMHNKTVITYGKYKTLSDNPEHRGRCQVKEKKTDL